MPAKQKMVKLILASITWEDGCTCCVNGAYIRGTKYEDDMETAFDIMEESDNYPCFYVNEFEITVPEKQAKQIVKKYNEIDPSDYIDEDEDEEDDDDEEPSEYQGQRTLIPTLAKGAKHD